MSDPGRRRPRSPLRTLARVAGPALLALDLAALAGFLARDRTAWLALLMYLPLAPLGLATAGLDLALRGRASRGPRFVATAIGLAAAACSGFEMIGLGPTDATPTGVPPIRLLHWNVLWGGRPSGDATWAAIEDDVLRRAPDVVILSEAPPDARLDSLTRRLGPGWTSTRREHAPGSSYWYRLVALSRWPVDQGRPMPIRHGAALDVRIGRPGRPLRLLIVDGRSRPTQLRTPMLQDVAEACRRAAEEGEPYDALAGDFNAVARSLGFDAIRSAAGGYEEASRSAVGWRGTWPMPLPIYDIDHVWVGSPLRVLRCTFVATPACDHRGQLVLLAPPSPSDAGDETSDPPGPAATNIRSFEHADRPRPWDARPAPDRGARG